MHRHTDTGVLPEKIHQPERVRQPILPWLVLVGGLALTVTFWLDWRQQHHQELQEDFRNQSEQIGAMIHRSLHSVELILLGVSGLFESTRDVSPQRFHAYVSALEQQQQLPEIQGLGFARMIPEAELAEQLQELRTGQTPFFRITPPGQRAFYGPIVFFEPLTVHNQNALGFDMFTETVRRQAMQRAWDTGQATMSERILLYPTTGETDPPIGAVIYMPIYHPGLPHETPEQRRENLLGWTFAPLRIERFMNTLLQTHFPGSTQNTRIELFEGGESDLNGTQPFFDSCPLGLPEGSHFHQTLTVENVGHVWTLRISALPSFFNRHSAKRLHDSILLSGGCVLTVLISLLIRALIRSQHRAADAFARAIATNEHLDHSRQQLQLIFDTTETAIFLTDMQGRITRANERMAEFFHCEHQQLLGMPYVELTHPSEQGEAMSHLHNQLNQSTTSAVCFERLYQRLDGGQFWGYVGLRLVMDRHGQPLGLVGVITDITQRKESEVRIQHLAHHDYLTGLPNRALFVERLQQAIKLARRYNRHLGLLFIDLDGFKPVNDLHGHLVGDQILQEVARRLQTHVRASDTVARLGGDEFVILVPEIAEQGHLEIFADHINTTLAEPYSLTQPPSVLGASIGMALFPDHGENLDTLLQSADTAMYLVKNSGDHVPRFVHMAG